MLKKHSNRVPGARFGAQFHSPNYIRELNSSIFLELSNGTINDKFYIFVQSSHRFEVLIPGELELQEMENETLCHFSKQISAIKSSRYNRY